MHIWPWPFFFLHSILRRISVRLTSGKTALGYVAAALLAASASASGRQQEKSQSPCVQQTTLDSRANSVTPPREGQTQDSPQLEEKKKRGLFHSWRSEERRVGKEGRSWWSM